MSNIEVRTVNFALIQFSHDTWGQLLVELPGQPGPLTVDPVRAFPLTQPEEQISLLDSEGREVFRIGSLSLLPLKQRDILRRELGEREFAPVIQRIRSIGASTPPCLWDVETDRGATQFRFESEDDLRRLPNGTVIIRDANGIRYLIPDVKALEATSQTLLRRFL